MLKRQAIWIAACLGLFVQQEIASAQPNQDMQSAYHLLVGCREFINLNFHDGTDGTAFLQGFEQGLCAGHVAAITHFGQHYGVCSPEKITVVQAARVIVVYIDQRPARMHERFTDLALEALQQAWPCRR